MGLQPVNFQYENSYAMDLRCFSGIEELVRWIWGRISSLFASQDTGARLDEAGRVAFPAKVEAVPQMVQYLKDFFVNYGLTNPASTSEMFRPILRRAVQNAEPDSEVRLINQDRIQMLHTNGNLEHFSYDRNFAFALEVSRNGQILLDTEKEYLDRNQWVITQNLDGDRISFSLFRNALDDPGHLIDVKEENIPQILTLLRDCYPDDEKWNGAITEFEGTLRQIISTRDEGSNIYFLNDGTHVHLYSKGPDITSQIDEERFLQGFSDRYNVVCSASQQGTKSHIEFLKF